MSEPFTDAQPGVLIDWREHYPHTKGREAMWSAREPFVQTAWDSTSLVSYMQCPRRYFYEIIEGWRPKGLNVDVLFGSTVHDSVEVYERARLEGEEHQAALRRAVRHALRMARGGFPDPVSGEMQPSLDDGGNPAKSNHAAIRVIVWWADEHGQNDTLPTARLGDGRPGLEISFRVPLDIINPDGDAYLLVGHFDKWAVFGDGIVPVERKTTKSTLGLRYWDKFSPNVQITNYALASQVLVPDHAYQVKIEAFQTGVTFARSERHTATRTPAYLEEWTDELAYWIKRAEEDGKRRKWPKNEATCSLNGGCPFRRICSKDPGVRDRYLKGEFQRLTWNPLRNR